MILMILMPSVSLLHHYISIIKQISVSENMGVKNSSGVNPMRSVARTIPGPSVQMDRAQAGGVSAGQAAAMALQVSIAKRYYFQNFSFLILYNPNNIILRLSELERTN